MFVSHGSDAVVVGSTGTIVMLRSLITVDSGHGSSVVVVVVVVAGKVGMTMSRLVVHTCTVSVKVTSRVTIVDETTV